ncbi:MAG TPA: class II fructose-bisphosphate aldolase [Lachnoclostridium phocaeense]|uniref:Class II fructose-bisphosphate aldolase n=1 Tax=Lachnoclostridium phocaeense TaxID=1871021 RepID=A0A921I234_9FIRM|nr:class II fructose-bisphosphate aldolase [Lachnoclostridium phocaeense]
MLVTLREVLKDAQEKKYGVGLFNTVNLEMAKGVLAAAEELKSPVIIGTAEVLLPYASLKELAYFLVPMAKKASVPVVLHYDHGLTDKKIVKAMRLGFSSIMYDCSTDTYENNIARVAQMVKIADMFGASVEGELGHVGANDESAGDDSIYTEPEQARDFAQRTGVDALAVAIGTAHGAYKEKPRLDIGRLAEISRAVPVPLVLHGGSGLSDEDFKNCVANGISKINIFTDINCAAAKAAHDFYKEGCGLTDIQNQITEAVKQETMKKMRIFGSAGRG